MLWLGLGLGLLGRNGHIEGVRMKCPLHWRRKPEHPEETDQERCAVHDEESVCVVHAGPQRIPPPPPPSLVDLAGQEYTCPDHTFSR